MQQLASSPSSLSHLLFTVPTEAAFIVYGMVHQRSDFLRVRTYQQKGIAIKLARGGRQNSCWENRTCACAVAS